jgi:uncharacterized membrane protein
VAEPASQSPRPSTTDPPTASNAGEGDGNAGSDRGGPSNPEQGNGGSEVGGASKPHGGAREWTLLQSGATLAVVGASVALGIGQVANTAWARFAAQNTASPAERAALLLDTAIGAVAGSILAWLLLGRSIAGKRLGRERLGRADRLRCAARLAAPLALTAVIPGLLGLDPWSDALVLSVALGAFVLAIEPLWRLHFSVYEVMPQSGGGVGSSSLAVLLMRIPPVLRRNGPALCVGAAALAYAVFMSFLALRSHAKFNTFNWDLGQLDNQFYNALHGHPFRCTVLIRDGDWSELRNHAEFSLFALLPFYALHPSSETLLVLQAVLLGAAAIPLYRLAARRLPPWVAAAIAVAYLLYPPLHGAQLFDFHFQPIAAAFLLAAFDCFDARRMRLFALFFLLAIGCREDISAGTAVFGIFLLLSGHRVRQAAVVTAVSVVWFVGMRFFLMPAVGSWGFADLYKGLFPAGEPSFAGIVKTIVTNPVFTFRTLLSSDKLRYALQILAPLAFLPLRRPYLMLSLLPGAFFTLLTTEYGPTLDIGYQYAGHFIPYIFPAAALALADRRETSPSRAPQRAAIATLLCATAIATFHWGAIPTRAKFKSCYGWKTFEPPTQSERRRLADLDELARLVPPDAVLAASDREIPHVSNRLDCWNLSVGFRGADYVLYTTVDPIAGDVEQVAAAKRAGYTTVAARPEIGLLKRPGAP